MERLEPGLRSAAAVDEHDAADVADRIARLMHDRAIHEALAVLNGRTRFRFTGVYRAEPPVLRNLHLFDRENPTLNVSGNVCALSDTYCSLTCLEGLPFATDDARRDGRLQTHPARDSVISYIGVPLRSPDGRVLGTLCHYDLRPRLIPFAELPVLERAAPLIAGWLTAGESAT